VPQNVPLLGTDTVRIECGGEQCFGLKASGSWVSWGRNADVGVLALGHILGCERHNMCFTAVPEDVPLLGADTVRVECGYNYCFGLRPSGSWVAWGSNYNGELALGFDCRGIPVGSQCSGSTIARLGFPTPQDVPLLGTDTVRIECKDRHCFGLKASGGWVSWGMNTWGQLALGTPFNPTYPFRNTVEYSHTPQDVTLLGTDTAHIVCGDMQCFGLKFSGGWVSWGRGPHDPGHKALCPGSRRHTRG
jgi:alpha-tubulin suppressor-like RCC1 family protein